MRTEPKKKDMSTALQRESCCCTPKSKIKKKKKKSYNIVSHLYTNMKYKLQKEHANSIPLRPW